MSPPVYIPKARLRQLFNAQGFEEQIRKGRVSVRILASHPATAKFGFPDGTVSQRLAYIDGRGHRCATVHRFLLPGGQVGASGRPDPKELLLDGELYLVDPNDQSE